MVNKAVALQRTVLLWILGPGAMVLLSYLVAGGLGWMIGANSTSWLSKLGSALVFVGFFGSIVAAHAFAFFGLIGVIALSRQQVPRKLLTMLVCLSAVAIATPILCQLYFGMQLFQV
jgi:hypothetical protein